MNSKIKTPPDYLKADGRKLWRGVLRDFEFTESNDFKLLAEAAACCDRIAEARAELEKAGQYYIDRFNQPKEHPAHKVEKDNKILLCRILRELNLDIPPPENRPPTRY